MKLRYIILVLSLPLILACGIQSAALQSQQTTNRQKATESTESTETPFSAVFTPRVTNTEAVRQMTVISGTWNIRTSPSLGDKKPDDNLTNLYAKAGDIVTVYGLVRGWLQIGDGQWICNRAVGGEEECQ